MTEDPIVKEVRDARQWIFADCAEDLERLLDRFQTAERDYRDRLVTADELRRRREAIGPEARERTAPPYSG